MSLRVFIRAVAVALLGVVLVANQPAHAVEESNIDYVDVDEGGAVSVLLGVDGLPSGTVPDAEDVHVSIDGRGVDATARPVGTGEIKRTSILALDSSLSMEGADFEAAKSAAAAYVNAAPEDVEVGLLTFSKVAEPVVAPTLDRSAVIDSMGDLELTLGTSLYDAVIEAIALAGDEGARSVLLLSDGRDQGSAASLDDAVAAARDDGVVIDVVALNQSDESRALLSEIAVASGGKVIDADSGALAELFTAQADALSSQLLVSFALPEGTAPEVDLTVSVSAGGQLYEDSAFVSLGSNVAADSPQPVAIDAPVIGATALWAGALAFGLGLAGLLVLVLVGSSSHSEQVRQQMQFYTRSQGGTGVPDPQEASASSLRRTAVATTEKFVKGDFESRVSQRLNGAGVSLTAAEWLLLHAGLALAAAFVGLTFGGLVLMTLFGLAGVAIPWAFLKFKHSRRLAAFNSQLAETLQLISGGLSAGLSLPQAIDTVVREGQEPVAGEMRRALVEQRLGVEIEDALDGVADRMESKDFSWVVMAVRIQREVGGNLAELLITVADTLRERDYLRGQVKVLSAEGRISAWVLGGMPILMFLYMLMVRRDFVRPLYTEPLGLVLSGVAVTLIALGFWTMSRLVKIEV